MFHKRFWRRSARTLWVLPIACVAVLASDVHAAEKNGKRKGAVPAAKDASEAPQADATAVVQLACDPQVRRELRLNPRQLQAIDAAYAKIEPALWPLRDASTASAAEERGRLTSGFSADLAGVLDETQHGRLRQLLVQGEGWSAVVGAIVAQQLKLSAEQRGNIEEIIKQTHSELQKIAASSDSPATRQKATLELRKNEGTSIQKLMSTRQRQKLAELVGEHYDLSGVQPLSFQAPELKQVDEWINSPPLTMSAMRGKVVAFHFWAFGCINCVHNLPHYAKWHDELAARGLVVLGMHTPETKAEHSIPALQAKIAEHAIRYPVAVDHDNQNWAAWANSMWPSVYLVDKRGKVRYWWYGEMNWQGTEGEKFMRERIEALLAENE